MTTIQQYESCGKANWVDDPLNIYYVLDLETIKYHGNIEKNQANRCKWNTAVNQCHKPTI